MISLATFLQFKGGRLGGVVGLGGGIATDINLSRAMMELKRKTKVFLSNGSADPIVPAILAKKSYKFFKINKFNYTHRIEPGLDHDISD